MHLLPLLAILHFAPPAPVVTVTVDASDIARRVVHSHVMVAARHAEIPKSVWDTVDFGHRIMGVPIMLQTYNVFANMDILKPAGIKAPTIAAPWTWTKFRQVAKQLTKNGNFGVCWGLRSPTALSQSMAARSRRGTRLCERVMWSCSRKVAGS